MIDPITLSPASAEFNASRLESVSTQNVTTQVQTASAANADSFSSVLAEVTSGVVSDLRSGERAAISGMNGNASVQHVVEAVMTAEQTLQSAIAVRDKVVSAYQEISRMAI
ncbi:MAG: flagellar hook-basal body complex protein FliE [Hyphomicrobiaceae bacterium]